MSGAGSLRKCLTFSLTQRSGVGGECVSRLPGLDMSGLFAKHPGRAPASCGERRSWLRLGCSRIDKPLASLERFDVPRPAEPLERLFIGEPIPGVVFNRVDRGIDLGAQQGEEDVLGDLVEVRPPSATCAKRESVLIVDRQ